MKNSFAIKILGWTILLTALFSWILFFKKIHGFWLLVNILYSLILAGSGIGIILLKSWARKYLLIIVSIKLVDLLVHLLINIARYNKTPVEIVVDLVSISIIAIFIFWFLNKKSIKTQFK